jgi:peroxiredoxin
MTRISINQKAPDFSLKDFQDIPVRLSDFRDRTNIILIFNRGFM